MQSFPQIQNKFKLFCWADSDIRRPYSVIVKGYLGELVLRYHVSVKIAT